ncbi:hypothetical protein GALL_478490 [mine drainage metagenome]|uniref:Uncharacterized protein n=1 Tax=mine drainage metagenome TaxID=410659 RepID=A0A1J5PZ35_9ZZZZ
MRRLPKLPQVAAEIFPDRLQTEADAEDRQFPAKRRVDRFGDVKIFRSPRPRRKHQEIVAPGFQHLPGMNISHHRHAGTDLAKIIRKHMDEAVVMIDQQHPLARQPLAVGADALRGARLLDANQLFGAAEQFLGRTALDQQPGDFPQGVAHVGNAVERALEKGNSPAFLHLARDIDHRLGTHHHRRPGAVAGGDLVVATVAGDARQDADSQCIEQRLDLPQLAHQVVFADDVDVVWRGEFGLARADDVIEQGLGPQLVAQVLRPGETRRVDGDHRLAELLAGALAHRLDVIADQRSDAGLVDEDGGRVVLVENLAHRLEQPLLAAVHHIEFIDVGGESGAVDL